MKMKVNSLIQYFEINKLSTVEQTSEKIRRRTVKSTDIDYVKKIMNDVKKNNDKALLKYTSKFDRVKLLPNQLRVNNKEIKEAYSIIDSEIVKELKILKKSVEKTEKKIMKLFSNFVNDVEIRDKRSYIKYNMVPLESVGCYVPGGKAVYPSSLVMSSVPAKIAGVKRIIVSEDSKINGKACKRKGINSGSRWSEAPKNAHTISISECFQYYNPTILEYIASRIK